VILVGRFTDFNEEHPSKTLSPIDVRLVGRYTEVNDVKFRKASSAMLVIVDGSITVVNGDPKRALLSITVVAYEFESNVTVHTLVGSACCSSPL